MNKGEVKRRVNEPREVRTKRRQRFNETKIKGRVNKNKSKSVTKFFSLNWNVFGPRSKNKKYQVIKESKRREIDGIMISLSNARWGNVNKNAT